jgi:hypothetical protein
MTTEEWRPVVGFEGYYEVSDQGRVRSVPRVVRCANGVHRRLPGVILAPRPRADGHLDASLCRGSLAVNHKVHQLVMAAFVGPRPAGLEVLHGNGDPTDNRRANLRYGTRSANALDAVAHGTHHWAAKTACPHGHPLAEPNLVPSKLARGYRNCLACSRERASARHHNRPFSPTFADARLAALGMQKQEHAA